LKKTIYQLQLPFAFRNPNENAGDALSILATQEHTKEVVCALINYYFDIFEVLFDSFLHISLSSCLFKHPSQYPQIKKKKRAATIKKSVKKEDQAQFMDALKTGTVRLTHTLLVEQQKKSMSQVQIKSFFFSFFHLNAPYLVTYHSCFCLYLFIFRCSPIPIW
jgi:hypothetical protein